METRANIRMKTLFLVALFLTLPALVSAETISFDDLVERNDLYYKKFSDVPFTGKVDGRIQGIIKRGKRQGLWLEYHENGQLRRKENYKDGKLHGLAEKYHENGQLESKGNYNDGKLHGLTEWYYKNGQLEAKANYKDGKRHGLVEVYRENGQLWWKENYKDGLEHGLYEWYYKNGQLAEKGNYKGGKVISRTCFSDSGEQKSCD